MASEQVLTVSLKEYKKSIDELRASLLGLEEGSDQYKAVVDEIKNRQEKLNEVMSVGKGKTKALEGSYDALVQQMAELKKVWRATADEAERDRLGKQILSINNKLKKLDASIGNYQRLVGNYSQGFVDGFNKVHDVISGLGNVAPVFSSIKGAMATAVTGVNGLTTAFTGLNVVTGGILIAIGAIVLAIKGAYDGMKSSEELTQRWTKAMAAFKPIVDAVGITLQAMGEVLVTIVEWGSKAFEVIMSIIPAYEELVEKEKEIADLQKEYDDKEGEIIQENAELHRQEEEARANAMDKELYNIKERKKYLEDAHKLALKQIDNNLKLEQIKLRQLKIEAAIKGNSEEENDLLDKQIAKVKELQAERNSENKDYNKQKTRMNNEERAEEKARLDAIKKEADERKKKAEEVRKKRIEEEKKYAEETKKLLQSIAEKGNDVGKSLRESLLSEEQKAVAEFAKKQDLLRRGMLAQIGQVLTTGERMSESMKKAYQDAFNYTPNTSKIENIFKGLLVTTKDFTEEQKDIIIQGMSGINLENTELAKLPEKLQKIFQNYNINFDTLFKVEDKTTGGQLLKTAKEQVGIEQKKLDEIYNRNVLQQERMDKLKERDAVVKNPDAKPEMLSLQEQTKLIEEEYNKRLTAINAFYDNERAKAQESIEKYKNIAEFSNSEEARLEAKKIIAEEEQKLRDLSIEKEIELADIEIELAQKVSEAKKKNLDNQVKNITAFAKSTSSLLGSVADAWKADLDMQVKNGEISEEQAEDEFERIKGLQIAQTVINTISGAIGAFLQDKAAYPAPYNYVIAGIDLASTLAAGYAQVKNIESQQYGSSSSSSLGSVGASVTGVGVNPLNDQNTDIMGLTSLTETKEGSKDTRVYVLESDISETQEKQRTRVAETSF